MSIILEIELLMTVALFLYFAAYRMAKNKNKYHKVIAIIGFLMDIYGTILMFYIKQGIVISGNVRSDVHTILSLLAIFLFFVQLTLGLRKKILWHRRFAIWIFFPVWILSFLSGGFLAHWSAVSDCRFFSMKKAPSKWKSFSYMYWIPRYTRDNYFLHQSHIVLLEKIITWSPWDVQPYQ